MALTSHGSFPLGVAVDSVSEHMAVWQMITQSWGFVIQEEGEDGISVYFNDLKQVHPSLDFIVPPWIN